MKKEDLKELGLTDEQAQAVLALRGKSQTALEEEKTTLTQENTDLKQQLADANATIQQANDEIEGFKKLDVDAIQTAADDWKQKYEAAEAAKTQEIAAMRKEQAIDAMLSEAKAKNAKAVKALLDMDAVTVSENGVLGLSEQLEKLKADNDFLFETEGAPPPKITLPTGKGAPITKTWKDMTLTERGDLFKQDKDAAVSLAKADGVELEA